MPMTNLMDCLNQKYDPQGSSLSATNAQDAIDELDVKPPNLSNAVFPDWAGSNVQGSTAINVGGNTDVNFSSSNKHTLTGTGATTIDVFTFPQANAIYTLQIPATVTISGVTATNKIEVGQNDLTAGKYHIMSILWDGTNAIWQTSEEV